MPVAVAQIIELEEEETRSFSGEELAAEDALLLHREYGKQINVEFPAPVNGGCYHLRSRGYVGDFPLENCQLHVRPKVELRNLFGMLEYAYGLRAFELLNDRILSGSIGEVFESLASVLARRVLDRVHGGLLREYVEGEEDLPYLRGRLLAGPSNRRVGTSLRCRFQEQTTDLMDNRILAWTLYQLRRFPFQREEVRRQVHQAFKGLAGSVDLEPVEPGACEGRLYHRLNQDYRPLHALCRFFLEQSGPVLRLGEREFMAFSVHMPALFEAFVAEWLKAHLGSQFELRVQHRLSLEGSDHLAFQIDLGLMDKDSGRPLAVLDTKYKRTAEPEETDIQQVVAYAVRMGTDKVVLIYPSRKTRRFVLQVGSVEVSSLVFDLGKELAEGGACFYVDLMKRLSEVSIDR